MVNRKFTFPKQERLSWKRHIDLLFANGRSFVAFPLRVIYLSVEEDALPAPASVLISVPKKKFKRAVKRNLIKRRMREAYRIHKHDLFDALANNQQRMLVAFLYLDTGQLLKGIAPGQSLFSGANATTGFA